MKNHAAEFMKRLKADSSPEELNKIQRYFKSGAGESGAGDEFLGVPMGKVFALAKEFMAMPLDEIDTLLEAKQREHYLSLKQARR
jgi:hypothetical protein